MAGCECLPGLSSMALHQTRNKKGALARPNVSTQHFIQRLRGFTAQFFRRFDHIGQSLTGFRPATGFQAAVRVHP